MPVPKRKRSKARRDSRHANKNIKPQTVADCKTCQAPILPHQICKECGHYKGIKVLATKSERAERRMGEKQEKYEGLKARMAAASEKTEE